MRFVLLLFLLCQASLYLKIRGDEDLDGQSEVKPVYGGEEIRVQLFRPKTRINTDEYLQVQVERCESVQSVTTSRKTVLSKRNRFKLLADCWTNLGQEFYWSRNYKKFLDYSVKASEIYEKLNLGPNYDVAKCLRNIGVAYSWLGDKLKEYKYLSRAMQMYTELKLGDDEEVATTMIYMGNSYARYRSYPKQLDYYQKALKMFMKLLLPFEYDNRVVADCLFEISLAHRNLGDYAKALEYSLRAYQLYDRLNSAEPGLFEPELASSLQSLGVAYYLNGYREAFLKSTLESLYIYENRLKLKNDKSVADCLLNLAIAYNFNRNFSKEMEYAQRAVDSYSRLNLGDMKEVAKSYLVLGMAYRYTNETNLELEYTQKAYDMYSRLSMTTSSEKKQLADCIFNLGLANRESADQGLVYLKQAYDMYLQLRVGDDRTVSDCLNSLSKVYCHQNDELNCGIFTNLADKMKTRLYKKLHE